MFVPTVLGRTPDTRVRPEFSTHIFLSIVASPMFSTTALKVVLGFWVLWHLVFGAFATFAPAAGAQLSGWRPEGGWTADMVGLSTQYGMVMILLALVYGFMALDPLRYVSMLWVAIAEQALGIGYAFYIYGVIGNITLAQMATQGSINVAVIALFAVFWYRHREHAASARS